MPFIVKFKGRHRLSRELMEAYLFEGYSVKHCSLVEDKKEAYRFDDKDDAETWAENFMAYTDGGIIPKDAEVIKVR